MSTVAEETRPNDFNLWLNKYATSLYTDGSDDATSEWLLKLKKTINLAAYIDDGAGLPEIALKLVQYAQSQIEFLKNFRRSNELPAQTSLLDLVRLRLEAAEDVVELIQLATVVHDKAPGTRLEVEAKAAWEYASRAFQAFDTVLSEAHAARSSLPSNVGVG